MELPEAFNVQRSTRPTPADDSDLQALIDDFNHLIQSTCKATLKPQHNPHPKGAQWWTEECTRLHTTACSAPPGPDHKKATKALKFGIAHTKQNWAHDKLH